jgi:hypothetical protein
MKQNLMPTQSLGPKTNLRVDDSEEEIEDEAKILSDAEYALVLSRRGDIFSIERDARLRNTVAACLAFGFSVGLYMTTIQIAKYIPDFPGILPEGSVTLVQGGITGVLERQKPQETNINKKEPPTDVRTLKNKPNRPGLGGKTGGGGDPRERITKSGVLGLVFGKIAGKPVANADIFGKDGFAKDIDGVILGMDGLKPGGSGGTGRKAPSGIGFGIGDGSGFGGGEAAATDMDNALNGLFGSEGGSSLSLIKKRGTLTISEPVMLAHGGQVQAGGRSRSSIMAVVMQNIEALRYAYNKRLREKPGLKGKITCKFAIDEFGKVIFCELTGSTMADPELEAEVKDKISRWVFEKIDRPGDVTEVQYPFVFSQ